jgi:hypothetical protein
MQIQLEGLESLGWVPPPPHPHPHPHGGGSGFWPWYAGYGGWGGPEYYPYPVDTTVAVAPTQHVSSIYGVDLPTAVIIGAAVVALTILIVTRKK